MWRVRTRHVYNATGNYQRVRSQSQLHVYKYSTH